MDPRMMMMLANMGQQGGGNYGGGEAGAFGGGNPIPPIFNGLQNIFGRDPYKDAFKQYQKYAQQGIGYHQPYYDAGKNALGGLQDWLGGMKDPSEFINKMMGQYKESPYAHNLQQQAMRAGQNMGSASGMTGSSPLMMQMQQNAGNIASQDQNQWLQNVLGINSQYGQGLGGLAGMGQGAAGQMSDIMDRLGQAAGGSRYGGDVRRQRGWSDIIGGIFG